MPNRITTRLLACALALAQTMPAQGAEKTIGHARVLERRLAGPDGSVMVVAHRGCWKQTSENSIDGIEACIAFGVDMVELDVRATADGVLVLMHDATVDRMTDGTGKVEELGWAYLQALHLREGAGRGSPVTTRRIPLFEDALRAAKGRILINIDAKSDLTREVLALVDRFGDRKQVLFKAPAPAAEVMTSAPWVRDVRFQPIIREREMQGDPKATIPPYDPIRPVGYEIDVVNPPIIATLRDTIRTRCARFWVNSLNGTPALHDAEAMLAPDRIWGRMIADGVDTIQTDEPLALKAYVASRGLETYRCRPRPGS
ncbi:glycerophosphodiester phosphodiesterase family protein [Sphingomonas sp. QA11]|uniref:glycerophosphodiester phosphodiesterase family protein n=1 Tax=Sphingomonas sp. QA11 TaxID=2950605 RepID=UPI00234938F7|nr:glycerophosphodiester phosphodiesterase family protein [Sphingomonas sp. QA11]WCM27325.1 glycerophosphodiester phosphodiesterase family protein [Sphingomonas sp. QA11]